jgi:hypothetical protein
MEKARPELVVLPADTDELSRVVRLCHRERVAFVPRGAGTGVSGGCLPHEIPESPPRATTMRRTLPASPRVPSAATSRRTPAAHTH